MYRVISFLSVLVMLLAACGGEASETTTTTEAQSATTEAPGTTMPTETSESSETTVVATGPVVMSVADGTEVRFSVDEVLRGDDVVVRATNTSVSGEVTVDFADPDQSVLGVITIDATRFVTDEDRRNEAIRRFILDTGDFPEVTFTPVTFTGADDVLDGGVGTITGDLTIRDITNEVTFEVTDGVVAEDGISASAMAVVNRTDWDLNIPSVPFVASVGEEVTLEIDLVLSPTG